MIIRNPYGFVARHFKLINLILIIPMIYLAFKLGDVSSFFSDYISSGYSTPETSFADLYINAIMYIITMVLLLSNIFLSFIFASKKKNNTIYLINSLYYVIIIILMFFFHSTMSGIEKGSIDATFANFIRDCALIAHWPMYILIIVNISKAVGFNYRTLRFDNNSDLKISEEDEEDIEIKVGSDDNSAKKTVVHLVRELKYYVLENKFVFMCIGAVFIIFLGYNLYKEFQIINKSVYINQAFSLDDFNLALKESYITDVDQRGVTITEGKYYLAVKMGIENLGEDTKISNSSFRIYIDNEVIYPSYDKSSRFADIGEAYQGETIRTKEAHDYVFVYELEKSQVRGNYQMRILSGLNERNGKLEKRYKKLSIKPQNITKTENIGEVKINEVANLKKTTLGETTIMLKKVDVAKVYSYQYELCPSNGGCYKVNDTVIPSGGKALLIIEDEINIDEKTSYYNYKKKDFYYDFASVNYQFTPTGSDNDNVVYKTHTLKNITPSTLKDVKVYEIPKTILEAEKISLVVRIRNKYFTVIISE